MEHTFWLPQSDKYIRVQDKIRETTPDFEFEEGKTYLVVSEKDCKVHEKHAQPELQEGVKVEYYFGKPKKFLYTPTPLVGDFWIVNDNVGGTNVTITEVE